MICDCINTVENGIIEMYKKEGEILVKRAKFADINLCILPGKVKIIQFSRFELTISGHKKTKIVMMQHNYCPFCGKKIEDDIQLESQKARLSMLKEKKKTKINDSCPHCESKNYYVRVTGWAVCRKCGTTWKRPTNNQETKMEEKEQ